LWILEEPWDMTNTCSWSVNLSLAWLDFVWFFVLPSNFIFCCAKFVLKCFKNINFVSRLKHILFPRIWKSNFHEFKRFSKVSLFPRFLSSKVKKAWLDFKLVMNFFIWFFFDWPGFEKEEIVFNEHAWNHIRVLSF
jgi:hypothetical protein